MRATLITILLHMSRKGAKTGGRQEIPADASLMVLALRVAVGAPNSPTSIDSVTRITNEQMWLCGEKMACLYPVWKMVKNFNTIR
jgi:hypothetical protein